MIEKKTHARGGGRRKSQVQVRHSMNVNLPRRSSLASPNQEPRTPHVPPPPSLIERLETMWKQPSSLQTAWSDFGRLAPRIIVLGTLTHKNSGQIEKKYGYENVDTRSFKVWINEEKISKHASKWSQKYKKCTLSFVRKKGKKSVFLRFYISIEEKNKEVTLYTAQLENVSRVCDSSRFFVIDKVKCKELESPGNPKTIGFAFHAKDQSDCFSILFRHFTGRDIPNRDAPPSKLINYKLEPEVEKALAQISEKDLQKVTQQINQIIDRSEYITDLPRVRESVFLKLADIETYFQEANGKKDTKETSHIKNAVAMKNVMAGITEQLDVKKKKKVVSYLNGIIEENREIDLALETKHIINDILSGESRSAKVLCALTQNIVSVCITKIKLLLKTTQVLTGDVQGPSGWQICILFVHDTITISHRRRERSLGTKPNAGFWFEWILNMTFDNRMTRIISCLLKVTDLHFEETIDELLKDKVKKALCNGELIIE